MTGEPTHTASKERKGAVRPSYTNYHLESEVSITPHCQLLSTRSLHNITNQELFKKHLCNPRIPKEKNGAAHPSYINYCLKSAVFIMLHCQLCSTQYTILRIKELLEKHLCNQSSYYEKIWMISIMKGSHHMLPPNRHLSLSTKMNVTQRRTLLSP